MQYLKNVALWLRGFARFKELTYKPGWSATSWGWRLLYTLDYGFNCLVLGNQVVSISRYCFLRRDTQPWKWFGALLDRIQPRHIEEAGEPLWGSLENPSWVRIAAPVFWLLIFSLLLPLIGHAL